MSKKVIIATPTYTGVCRRKTDRRTSTIVAEYDEDGEQIKIPLGSIIDISI